MKKNILFVAFLVCLFNLSLMGQERIAVIPFTGLSAGEANLLADMISGELEKVGGYQIAPRTSAINAVIKEQNIQRTGLTDADTIGELGRGANAQFVVSGHVQKLGDRNLVSASIIDVETLQQISGDYFEYGIIDEVVEYLPTLAEALLSRMNTDYKSLPTLAVLPFEASTGVSATDRDVLAQILAIEIANSGKYAVVARTTTISNVMKEQNIQRQGLTDSATISKLGVAINAEYVLSGNIRKLGNTGYISASIINVSSITLEKDAHVKYKAIADGIKIVPRISYELTGVTGVTGVTDNKELAKVILNKLLEEYEGEDGISEIKALLDKGINAQDKYSMTALYTASYNGHTEIVKALISAGADLNIQDNYGRTALYRTSEEGHTEVVKVLIEAGADVNIKANDGRTALYWASYNGYTEVVRLLKKAGARK